MHFSIVAIHGLNGHRETTFTTHLGGVNWLQDLLPLDIPNARILTYGYDSRTHGFRRKTTEKLYNHSINLLESLRAFREKNSVCGCQDSVLEELEHLFTHMTDSEATNRFRSAQSRWYHCEKCKRPLRQEQDGRSMVLKTDTT